MELLLNALAALLASWLVRWLARRLSGEVPGELAAGVEHWARLTLRLLLEAAAIWAAGRIRRAGPPPGSRVEGGDPGLPGAAARGAGTAHRRLPPVPAARRLRRRPKKQA